MPPAPTVFISYSHKDEVWKDRLLEHLGGLEEEGLLKVWSDRNIKAGDEWFEEIRTAMDDAKVAVFLVSAHSLKSKFIRHKEIPHLLDRRANEGMTFFPVIVRDCVWDEFPWLSGFQVRPSDRRPLESFRGKLNSELTKIAKEILGIIRNGATGPQPLKQTDPLKLTTLAPLHQLPTPPVDFTGREEDLEFLRSKLTPGKPGAIFGTGGVGKTTLALKLADDLRSGFPDAQIYLDLKGVDPQSMTAAQAMAHVVRSFHPEAHLPESEAELAALYRSVLDGKRVLLLMDNAAKDKKQIEPLIPPPTCLLLVTSRFRFALPGLVDQDLDEMSGKDAKDLLLRIAPRIIDNADEIAGLCGCLPLALRLAGSALAERPDLSPTEYIRRRREGKEKLEPVEASLQTSYDLLTEERQRLWRLLSVFPDTFNAEAVAAVWGLEKEDASVDLGELVRCSLVDWEETEGRYRLHDLARAFAGEKITAAEHAEVRRRHAEHFLKVLRSADSLYEKGGQDLRLGLALFDREWSNIRAGQAWAAAQFRDYKEAADLCSGYPIAGAYSLELRLHPREKIRWREVGLEASLHLKNKNAEAFHLAGLGLAFTDLSEPLHAIELYEKFLDIARETGNRRGEAIVLGNMGIAYKALGKIRSAIELYEQDLNISRQVGNLREEGNVLGNLGNAYVALSETRRAIQYYEQSLMIARKIGDRRGEGITLGHLGFAYTDIGKPVRAIEFLEQQLTIARDIGNRRVEGNTLIDLGNAYADLGKPRRAIKLYEHSLTIARDTGNQRGEASGSWNLGLVLAKEGELARAFDLMQVYVDYLLEIGHPDAEKRAAGVAALRARIADAARD